MSQTPRTSPPRRRARLWKILAALIVLAALFVVAFPTLATLPPLRGWILGLAGRALGAQVTVDRVSFGWTSPIGLYEFAIRPPKGPPLLQVTSLEGDRTLWQLLTSHDWGTFRCTRPHISLEMGPEGTNLTELVPKPSDGAAKRAPAKPPAIAVRLQVVDATVSIDSTESDKANRSSWDAKGINFAAGLRRDEHDSAQTLLIVEPGMVFDHVALTPEICRAGLQYVAPVLADATQAEGSFSLDLDEWRIPLGNPGDGHLSGRLTIHEIDVVPGPVVRLLSELFGAPASLLFANETKVDFEMHDRRIYHRNLAFAVSALRVRTSGSVGVDQTLDLTAEVTLPQFANEQAPVRRTLSGRTLTIPIRGTLAKPEIDRRMLTETGLGLLSDTLNALLAPRQPDGTSSANPSTAGDADAATAPAGNENGTPSIDLSGLEDILRGAASRLRQRRSAGAAPSADSSEESASPPPANDAPSGILPRPRRRVRRLLDRLEGPGAPAAEGQSDGARNPSDL